jgi:hypothetical protein
MPQVVEHLPNKYKALNSNSNTERKKNYDIAAKHFHHYWPIF